MRYQYIWNKNDLRKRLKKVQIKSVIIKVCRETVPCWRASEKNALLPAVVSL